MICVFLFAYILCTVYFVVYFVRLLLEQLVFAIAISNAIAQRFRDFLLAFSALRMQFDSAFFFSSQDNSTERENREKKVDRRKNLHSFTIPDYGGKIPIFAHIFFPSLLSTSPQSTMRFLLFSFRFCLCPRQCLVYNLELDVHRGCTGGFRMQFKSKASE